MNVTLPEENKIKKKQLILYISIILMCIVSIIIAFMFNFMLELI